ncbi:hypothetical protein [Corallococcus sicarius]|uniref:hypothetical protein n=1 Tax=Corallococcus sicarius TaxID=2316726 RepID=UPI0011C347A1|nr:hypothetical protein [Corallococcus sicarius]
MLECSIAQTLVGLFLVMALGACRTTKPVEQDRLRVELERAVLADQEEIGEDRPVDEHFQAFLKKYGEDAVPFFERLVVEAADSGWRDDAHQVNAAVRGLVALQGKRAQGVLKKLASSKTADLLFSQIALNALVGLAPESEKVGLLIARLREGRHPEDQQWAVGTLITLGRTEAVPCLKELRAGISDARTLININSAVVMLGDPGVCNLYSESQGGPSRLWSCRYQCAGAVRGRERVMEAACPRTLPNKDE